MTRHSRKLVDAAPTWAPFDGWSVLLEHGAHGAEGIGLVPGRQGRGTAVDHGAAAFVDGLAAGFCELRRSDTPFARLPAASLHITLCDGLNAGLSSEHDLGAAAIRTVPRSRIGPELDRLLAAARTPLRWRPHALEIRGHAVVVAVGTDDLIDEIERRRSDLLATLGELVDRDLDSPWRPHISIGYLLHDGHLDDDLDDVARAWSGAAPVVTPTLTTHGAAVYEFDDMATFNRSPETRV